MIPISTVSSTDTVTQLITGSVCQEGRCEPQSDADRAFQHRVESMYVTLVRLGVRLGSLSLTHHVA